MELGFALRRRASLPGLADGAAAAALGGVPALARARARGCRWRATRRTTAAGCRRSRTGCTSRRRPLWIGGLLSLGLVVWNDRELRRTAFWRFSEIAGPLVALVVAAGVYMTFKRFPALDDLWDVGYGRLLLVKLGLVSLALSWGAFHHFVVRPRLERPAVARRLPRRSRARPPSPSRSCCSRRSWSTRSRRRSQVTQCYKAREALCQALRRASNTVLQA